MAAGFPRNPSCPSGRPDHPPVVGSPRWAAVRAGWRGVCACAQGDGRWCARVAAQCERTLESGH
eukprot:3949061-Pyramimonas_sp.AAC.1